MQIKKQKNLKKRNIISAKQKKILLWAAGDFELEIKEPVKADSKTVDEIGLELAKRIKEALK